MPAVTPATTPRPLWMVLPIVHAGSSVFLLVAAGLVAVWTLCAVLVAAGLALGHVLVTAARALISTASKHHHRSSTVCTDPEPSEDAPDSGTSTGTHHAPRDRCPDRGV